MLDAKVDTLLAVAETLNYTKAAQVLSLTQPACRFSGAGKSHSR